MSLSPDWISLSSSGGLSSSQINTSGNVNIGIGGSIKIDGVDVITSTSLGSGVIASNLTSVGTLGSLAVEGDLSVDTGTLKVDSTNNRVGVNTSSPGHALDVTGSINFTGDLLKNGVAYATGESSSGGSSQWTTSGNNIYYTTGNVGVGTNNPLFPLHVTSPELGGDPLFQHGFLNNFGTGSSNQFGNQFPVQAKFTGTVHATLYRATSDARIKKDISEINDGDALVKLRLIQPKRYKYIDQVTHGPTEVFGFIAQEVREIFPEAVALNKDVVPDIYTLIEPDMSNRLINVGQNKARSGVLRIFTMRGSREINVIKVDANIVHFDEGVITQDDLKDNYIFVYGFEVDDFHSMKKDQLWAINFAATQEIDRKLQTLQTKVDDLVQILQDKNII